MEKQQLILGFASTELVEKLTAIYGISDKDTANE